MRASCIAFDDCLVNQVVPHSQWWHDINVIFPKALSHHSHHDPQIIHRFSVKHGETLSVKDPLHRIPQQPWSPSTLASDRSDSCGALCSGAKVCAVRKQRSWFEVFRFFFGSITCCEGTLISHVHVSLYHELGVEARPHRFTPSNIPRKLAPTDLVSRMLKDA